MSQSSDKSASDKIVLLVDAKNALYRAIYAVKADVRSQFKNHYMVVFLRQIASWIRRHNPESVHVFWDAPRKEVWRRSVSPTYKDRTSSTYVEDISADLASTTAIAMEMFKYLNVRQYFKKQMEADDLIYTAASLIHPKRNVIVSTDSDMLQVPFMFSSSSVYDPKKSVMVEVPKHNPALMKAIVGDKSDLIIGYHGIGPVKGAMLLDNPIHLQEFLNLKGRDIYHRNMLLTDLSLCPKIMANKLYVQKTMASSIEFAKPSVLELSKKYKLVGLEIEYADIIPPFMQLS